MGNAGFCPSTVTHKADEGLATLNAADDPEVPKP